MKKVFYKCQLMPCEEGLSIYVKKFISVHETPCFNFCIEEHNKGRLSTPLMREGENNRQALERMNVKVFRVAKSGSRIAFETEQEAYDQLLFLKRRQLAHLNRDIEFLNNFISYGSDKQFKDIPFTGSSEQCQTHKSSLVSITFSINDNFKVGITMSIEEYETLSDVPCPDCGSDFMALSIESSREIGFSRIQCSDCVDFMFSKKTHEEGLIKAFEKKYKIKITKK